MVWLPAEVSTVIEVPLTAVTWPATDAVLGWLLGDGRGLAPAGGLKPCPGAAQPPEAFGAMRTVVAVIRAARVMGPRGTLPSPESLSARVGATVFVMEARR